jgi:hypothetical protein
LLKEPNERRIFGTSNPAKLQMIRDALAPLGLQVKGTHDLGITMDVKEGP